MKIKPFVCKVSYDHIPSVNRIYQPRRGGGMMLTNEARLYKHTIAECFAELDKVVDWQGDYPWVFDNPYIDLEMHFIINKGFNKRDTSNMIKITEDAISEFFEINDHNHLSVTAKKYLLEESDKEYLIIIYKPSELDIHAYKEKLI